MPQSTRKTLAIILEKTSYINPTKSKENVVNVATTLTKT